MALVRVLTVKTCIICSWPMYDILLLLLPSFCQHDPGTVLPQPAGEAILFGWDWICQCAWGVWHTYWWKFYLWNWILQGETSGLLLFIFKKWYWLSRLVLRVDPEGHHTQFDAHKQVFSPLHLMSLLRLSTLCSFERNSSLLSEADWLFFSRGRG